MRTLAVAAFILFIIVYAQRDWFRALCGLVVFTALTEYPGLPNPFDARGINHWSVMFAAIVFAWMISKVMRPRPWNIPRGWLIVIGLYLLVEIIGVARLCWHLDVFKERAAEQYPGYAYYNVRAVFVDVVYSPMRYMLLGLLVFDGARTRRQLLYGLCAVMGAVLIYALVVNKEIPLESLAGDGMQYRHRISKWTNRHPNDLARLFVATFWIGISLWQLKVGSLKLRLVVPIVLGCVIIALGHTHSRGGYLAFVVTGLILALTIGPLVRSVRIVGILGCAVIGTALFAPSVTARLLHGVDTSGAGDHDVGDVMAGRDVIWQGAILGIEQAPLIGHGYFGYVMSEAFPHGQNFGEAPIHPHNAYLETLLDHGILGAGGRLGPFLYVFCAGVILVRRRSDPFLRLIGMAAVAWPTAAFVMGISGQHWGLTENLFTFWCIAGLAVRALTIPDTVPQPAGTPVRYHPHASLSRSAITPMTHAHGSVLHGTSQLR